DMQLVELGLVDFRGRAQHEVGHRLRLRKRDHITDVVRAAEHHHYAVDAWRDAPMWRHAVGEGAEQRAEALTDHVERHTKQLEYSLLHPGVVDPQASAAQLVAIAHD